MIERRELGIEGASLLRLRFFDDHRGGLVEFFRQEWVPFDRPPVQGNLSRSRAGVLRGLHFHHRQWDFWFVVQGVAFVALVDLRGGAGTAPPTAELRLRDDEPSALVIPPGVAHGFYAETDLIMEYLVTDYFDGTDEHGVAWDDPALGIGWPTADPVLSDRDRGNPSLAETLAGAP